ncbi:MAG: MFS transporter [Verrucomicrobiota bacterium]|jgi:MFS family permease
MVKESIALPKADYSAARWHSAASTLARPGRAGMLTALFVTGFATFVNLYSTQPLLPRFREIFHASELMVSLTVSAPILAVALAAPFLGLVADSLGRKRVIVASMLALSLPTALAATAWNLPQLIAWRFLQGLFTPGIIAVAMAYISEETPPRLAGSTMAIYVTGGVMGGFCGRFASGLIAAHWGWRTSMVILGIATFVGAMLTWWRLPRSRKFVRQNNAAQSFASLRMHLRHPQLLATYAVGFNVLFCLVGVFTYVNFYLADPPFSFGPAPLASIFAVYLIGAVVTPFSGQLLDRIGHRRVLIAAASVTSVGVLLTLIRSVPFVIAGLALAASGAFASQAGASSHVGKVAGHARSSAAGVYLALYYLGGCAGSVLPGLFWKETGWIGCVGLMICMQSVTVLVVSRLWVAPKTAAFPPVVSSVPI